MLKYIWLWLNLSYYEEITGSIQKIQDQLQEKAVSLRVEKIPPKREEAEAFCREAAEKKEELLLLTDSPEWFSLLYDRGLYVLAVYHPGNRGGAFPQARYAVEDLLALEYTSYDEAYRRMAHLPWNILETERLKVRESTLEDVDDFYEIYQEPSITYYMEDLFPQKEAETAYMKAYIDQIYGFYGYGLWTVIHKESGKVIGRAGLSLREGYEMPELGFVIAVPFQGKGYGYEVCRAILGYAGEVLEFQEIQALVDEKNLASLGLLQKLGFEYRRRVLEGGHSYELYVKKI